MNNELNRLKTTAQSPFKAIAQAIKGAMNQDFSFEDKPNQMMAFMFGMIFGMGINEDNPQEVRRAYDYNERILEILRTI